MPKHKHHDMIVAKAARTELVVFIKMAGEWEHFTKSATKLLSFSEDYEYFLCLPKFEKECLHWLNGGEVQEKGVRASEHYWSDSTDVGVWARDWHEDHVFMCEVSMFRIKPKTININGHEVPEPYRGEMSIGQGFYWVSLGLQGNHTHSTWSGGEHDHRLLERGLIHMSFEDAEKHTKALLSFTKSS